MLLPGMKVSEIEPLQEGDETWKGLSVTFPSHIATHSAVQNFYFGKDNLIRRHDYHVDADNFYAHSEPRLQTPARSAINSELYDE